MAGDLGLFLRGHRFYLRRRVPLDLVDSLGKTHVTRALGTADYDVARRMASRQWCDLDDLYSDLRAGRSLTVDATLANADVSASPKAENASITVGDAMELFRREGGRFWGRDAAIQYGVAFEVLFESVGPDRPLQAVDRKDCLAVRDVFAALPANRNKRKATRGKTIAEACAIAADQGLPTLSTRTINCYLDCLTGFFGWAVIQGLVARNPMQRLRLQPKEHARHARNAFPTEAMNIWFGSPIYTGCLGDRHRLEPGPEIIRDGRYWIPILGLFTGARLDELCKLRVADVETNPAGWHLHLNAASQGKTANAERCIPLHPVVIDLGFVDWWRDGSQEGDLFAELTVSRASGKRGTEYSKWFGRSTRRLGIWSPKTTFHSFRHTFKDAMDRARIPDTAQTYLLGHAGRGTKSLYGDGYWPEVLQPMIAAMAFPGLNACPANSGETIPPSN